MLLNSATANDGCRISNDKRVHATHAVDWEACASRVLVVTSRDDELFSLSRYSSKVDAVETTAPAPEDGRAPQKIAPRYGAIRSVSVSV
jgi:hypothetical protein